MIESPQQIFWREIDLIQIRHILFFPEEQKSYISIQEADAGLRLTFLEGYNLSSVITLEIELAFKFVNQ